jgi:hypothetical protein
MSWVYVRLLSEEFIMFCMMIKCVDFLCFLLSEYLADSSQRGPLIYTAEFGRLLISDNSNNHIRQSWYAITLIRPATLRGPAQNLSWIGKVRPTW